VLFETLECRRLLSDAAWGAIGKLIGQDQVAQDFPGINGKGQSVAVIDTGIDYNNPLLGGGFGPGHKVVGGWDFVDNDADPMDDFGHGTEVAGVIASDPFTFDGAQYQGVAPGCNLVALRVDGADDPVPDERIQAALQWVIDHRTQFNIVSVNISFGSGHYSGTHTSIYSPQLKTLKQDGVFVAAASGNNGVDPSQPFGVEYPAADPNVFSVGAVDSFDTITEFTERGRNLDLLAPGDNVPTPGLGPEPFDDVSGTSFATPFVAGAVALMKQADSSLAVADEYSIFHAGSDDNFDGDAEFGSVTKLTYQRLDLLDAVSLASQRAPGPFGNTGLVGIAADGNDLAYDSDGVLHIVYYDGINRTMKYVTRSTCGELSAPMRIDGLDHDLGGYLSLALDAHGRPSVAYFDGTAGDLRYAHFNGRTWDTQVIDSKGSVGLYPSIAYDGRGHVVISYFQKSLGDLRVASFDGKNWSIDTVDDRGTVGRSTDLAYDAKTHEMALAYEDSGKGRLMVARNSGTGWTRGLVDNDTIGVTHVSIAFDPKDDQPAVSYYDIRRADLKYAKFAGSMWHHQRLVSRGAQGLYTQLFFSAAGTANIIYYSRKSDLVARLWGGIDSSWDSSVLQTGGGRYISAAENPSDTTVSYTWFEPGVAKLRVEDLAV
jgi:hypothetical protein